MQKDTNKRVVITGIGPVTSIGIGRERFWQNLLKDKSDIRPIPDHFENDYKFKSKFYVPFPEFTIESFGFESRMNILTEETSRLALVGTKLAFEDAGIDAARNAEIDPELAERTAVVLGNGICTLKAGFEAFATHAQYDNPELLKKFNFGPRFNRMVIPAVMPDSPSCWISIQHGLNGETFTLNTSCASGTYAIGEAFRKIRDGYADRVISGGVECLQDNSGTIMRGFDTLGTLTRSEDGFPRPFSDKRSGFLFAEGGGCILVLERLDLALSRKANIYCEVLDYESSSDAFNLVQIEPSGNQIKRMIRKVMGDRKIDYVNAHGTATTLNDEFERKLILELFGKRSQQPLVNSTKGTLGHTIGASGAIEAAVAAMSIKTGWVHRNVAAEPFEDLNLPEKAVRAEISVALSTSYGFGGHNAALLFGKWNG
jgi:3-oxoacyl-[acyl-carrier-protein] synthase II